MMHVFGAVLAFSLCPAYWYLMWWFGNRGW